MAIRVSATNERLQPSSDPLFRLHRQVRLRHEAFGGIAFHRQTGHLIEVDHEAFALLALLGSGAWSLRTLAATARSAFGRRVPVPEVASIVEALAVRGILEQVTPPPGDDEAVALYPDISTPTADLPSGGSALSIPITVHWAITHRCGLACPHCYTPAHKERRELSLEEKLQVVERLAVWGVLEVALGGGEPTACPHLGDVLQAVRGAGMVSNLTTNGQNISPAQARVLAETCGRLQLSLDRPEVLDAYRGPGAAARAFATAALLGDAGALVGANLLLVPENISSIQRSLWFLQEEGIPHVVLLRPFGDCSGRWPPGWPAAADWAILRSSLQDWAARQPNMSLEVACGLSFLLDGLPADDRRARLAFGCSGGRRFFALLPDGAMQPCSHWSSPPHRLVHILEDDLPAVWRRAKGLTGASACGTGKGLEDHSCFTADIQGFPLPDLSDRPDLADRSNGRVPLHSG